MALPRVKIFFENGALGSVAVGADGVVGLVATAVAVSGKLFLATAYVLHKLDDLAALGVTDSDTDANAFLYRQVKLFYDEAGDGAELWIMGFPNTAKQSDLVDKTKDYAKLLIQAAGGRLRALAVAFNEGTGPAPTPTDEPTPTPPEEGSEPPGGGNAIISGVDGELFATMPTAQALAEWAADSLFAPLFVLLEARRFNGTVTALADLSTYSYNRVGVMLGDTVSTSTGAAIGLLLGRIARISVQKHIGRVRDGALKISSAFIRNKTVESADVETIHNKGYITFRTFTGKAGYFFSNDSLATAVADDYRSIARRRTIDKAYRIAYATLIEFLNDEVPITDTGELVPAMVKSWESEVEQAIISGMTSEGNLGVDPTDPADTGVKCFIDYAQQVVSTGKIEISLKVKPFGYAQYIDVKLGFITVNN